MNRTDIRAEIAERRLRDIEIDGAAQGLNLPAERTLPIVPFLREPAVVCEVKRRSPSVDNINNDLDPVEQVRTYRDAGVKSISVLTEQNYFSGSLEDLVRIKTAMPDMAVLRKDFLLSEEDVEISCRAGADAFLLIASLLEPARLRSMYNLGIKLGMTPVVELHSEADIAKAAAFSPGIVGINSRDLRVFRIKPLQPLRIRSMIGWDCRIIYESGIKNRYDIDFVRGTGFDAALVGEAAVRSPSFAAELARSFPGGPIGKNGAAGGHVLPAAPGFDRFTFWKRLYARCRPGRPLVKICGITSAGDLERVIELGADAAGFILADSPRRVEPSFIESCAGADILKVGVVVLGEGENLPEYVDGLLQSGALDAVQFHGNELPDIYLNRPGYKAARIGNEADADAAIKLPGPAVLIDAFSREARGGTGRRIEPRLVKKIASERSLWLAGGINPGNVYGILADFRPELIDVSSGVEISPGKKDHAALGQLFNEINRAEEVYRTEE